MKKAIAILFLLPMFLVGCVKISATNKTYGDMLSSSFEGFMSIDIYSNNKIKYISLDLNHVSGIKEEDRTIITKNLKKDHNVEIRYDSIDSLEIKGLYNKNKKSLDGVLLTVTDIKKVDDNNYIIKGSKFRKGDNPTEIICSVQYINGSWKVLNAETPKTDSP